MDMQRKKGKLYCLKVHGVVHNTFERVEYSSVYFLVIGLFKGSYFLEFVSIQSTTIVREQDANAKQAEAHEDSWRKTRGYEQASHVVKA